MKYSFFMNINLVFEVRFCFSQYLLAFAYCGYIPHGQNYVQDKISFNCSVLEHFFFLWIISGMKIHAQFLQ